MSIKGHKNQEKAMGTLRGPTKFTILTLFTYGFLYLVIVIKISYMCVEF